MSNKFKLVHVETGEILGEIDCSSTATDAEVLNSIKQIFQFRVENGIFSIDRALANGDKPKDKNLYQINPTYVNFDQEEIEMIVGYTLLENCHLFNMRVEPVVVSSE